jgi:hypothetical protein
MPYWYGWVGVLIAILIFAMFLMMIGAINISA